MAGDQALVGLRQAHRSTGRAWAAGVASATAWRTRSCESHGFGRQTRGALAWWLASTSSCSTSRVARSMPLFSRATARSLAAASSPARCQALHLQLQRRQRRAQFVRRVGDEVGLRVEGLVARGRTAGSARAPAGAPRRAGRSSLTAVRSSAWRSAICRRTRATGASELPTTHHTTSHQQRRHHRHRGHGAQRQGTCAISPPHGHVLRHLDHVRARLHREHAVRAAARLARPKSPAPRAAASSARADGNTRRPSAVQTWTTKSRPLVVVRIATWPSQADGRPERRDSAICCMW
jgi:hypothetical protein